MLFHFSVASRLIYERENVLIISIKRDFPEIAKMNTQQEKPVFYNHKNEFRKIQSNVHSQKQTPAKIKYIFFATRAVSKIGECSRIFPSFSWEIFGHVTYLHQSRASKRFDGLQEIIEDRKLCKKETTARRTNHYASVKVYSI